MCACLACVCLSTAFIWCAVLTYFQVPDIEVEHSIAQDATRLLELCSVFSSVVLESIVALLENPELVEHRQFIKNLKRLLTHYKVSALTHLLKLRAHYTLTRHAHQECVCLYALVCVCVLL